MPPKNLPKTQNRTRREEKLAYDSDYYDEPVEDPVSGRLRHRPPRKMAPTEPDSQAGTSGNTLTAHKSPEELQKDEVPITNKKRPGSALKKQRRRTEQKISQGNSTEYQVLQDASKNCTLCKIGRCRRSFARVKQWKDHARAKHPEYMELQESERRRKLNESLHHGSDVSSSRIVSEAADEIAHPVHGEHEDLIPRSRPRGPEDDSRITRGILGRSVGSTPVPESSTSEWCHCKIGSCQGSFSNTKLMNRHIKSKHRKYWKHIKPSRQHNNSINSSKDSLSHHFPNAATEVAGVASRHTYGDGGREDFIPRDGTSLTRLVERLSREGGIQKMEDCVAIKPYSGSHRAKGHEQGGGDGNDEVMNELEEVRTEKHIEQKLIGKAKVVGQPREVVGRNPPGA